MNTGYVYMMFLGIILLILGIFSICLDGFWQGFLYLLFGIIIIVGSIKGIRHLRQEREWRKQQQEEEYRQAYNFIPKRDENFRMPTNISDQPVSTTTITESDYTEDEDWTYEYFDVKVAGSQYPPYEDGVADAEEGDQVFLEAEPDNEYDEKAILVVDCIGQPIGHIARGWMQSMLNDFIRREDIIDCEISKKTGKQVYIDVRLKKL